MDKKEVAAVLEEIANLLEMKGENPFKVRAFSNGVRIIENLSQDLSDLVTAHSLKKVKGIGEGLAQVITELVQKGQSTYHLKLRSSVPEGLLELLDIQGLGPKRVKVLYEELGIKNVGQLEYACQENRLLGLERFGEKLQKKILEAIKHRNKTKGYFLVSQAMTDARGCVAYLGKQKGAARIEIAGSLRRANEIVHDIDILVSTETPANIHRAFTSYPEVADVLAHGETKSSVILKSGMQVDLRTVTERQFPYALYYFTGSKEHNVATRTLAKRMGLKINEYGIFKGKKLIPCRDEAGLFKVLGLHFIPPELREQSGEIEAAQKGPLPELVKQEDIKGVFHVHSTYSDGGAPLADMIRAALDLGYHYVGISDHSKTAVYANGLTEARVAKQRAELDRLRKKFKPIRIFHGIESDILPDGSLDYPDRVLREFDFVIGSIHSRFNMNEEEMTKRICRAMAHPAMTMWGHPTGRLLLGRAGYPVNYEAIFEAARKNDVAIEINANPHRLDLDWRFARAAKAKGLRFTINPDAHSREGLADVSYGVGIARKGWLEAGDVLNTMTVQQIERYLKNRSER